MPEQDHYSASSLESSPAASAKQAGRAGGAAASAREARLKRIEHLEQQENRLWRVMLLFLVLVATAMALNSWQSLADLPGRAVQKLLALPAGVLIFVLLLCYYIWRKKREIAELRAFVRGVTAQAAAPPSEEQMERLLEILSRSQQGYRDLIDSLSDVMFSLSLDGTIRAANRSFAEMVDADFGELIGRRADEIFDEPTLAQVQKHLPAFLERRRWSGVARLRRRNTGQVHYFDCIVQAVVKSGEVVAVSVLGRDVTPEREAEARFAELFETLQEGVYFTTPDGHLLDANPALVRMLGYASKEELLEINVVDVYADPADRRKLLGELDQKNAVGEREIRLKRKDGTVIECLDTSTAIRDSRGQVVRYQGTLVDITQRREMERYLHEEKEFARRLVDSLPDLVVVVDRLGRYTYVSPRIRDVLGFTPEELILKRVGDRSHEDDRPQMLQMVDDLMNARRGFATVEYRTRHKDGSWRFLRATASPLFDSSGQITGVIASARDMTEVKRLEQQVIQSEKLAAMGQMIAGVAHELNNPLTAILGITDLLHERTGDEAIRRQLELVQRQARRAAEIVQNLLTFARPPAPRRGRLNLGDIVQHAVQLHEYSLRTSHIEVDFDPGTHIPAELPPVVGDSNQLIQVFLNLIVNAEQAIRESGQGGRLTVRVGFDSTQTDSQVEPSVWVTIRDDGPGIAPDILPKIFDPFFTTKRPGRGTGLGLSICMAIVREHGGTIEARNYESGGAWFRIRLPIRFTSSSRGQAPPAEEGALAATSPSPRADN
jgi:two-component system NtrC family sensor kinase